jgi:hypothetical protein
MKFVRRLFFVAGIGIMPFWGQAQFYNAGQEPASLKWRRISSLNFEVIYPESFEVEAHKVVNLMEMAYNKVGYSLDHLPSKVSLILHTQTVKSNAFLGWAPQRIEMYTTPNQNIYSTDWMQQLAVHEYRHMVQLSKIDQEMPQLFRILFGDLAAASIAAVHVPFWILEGDAVTIETALSNSGRGRKPDFIRETKAQVVEKGAYNFGKAYLGSFKDFVPNHYQMGYFMVAGSRDLFNENIWSNSITRISRNPLKINALNKSIIKETGLSKSQLYDSIYSFLKLKWTSEIDQLPQTNVQRLSRTNKVYTNYLYPHYTTTKKLITLKSALNLTDRFIEIDSLGNEKTIFVPGYIFNESVSMQANQIIWSEYDFHLRWTHNDGTLVRILDTETKTLEEFQYKTKLFAACLSPDLKTFAAVEIDDQYRFFLSIYNARSGALIKKIATPDNRFLMTPKWINANKLVMVSLHKNIKNIELYDLEQDSWTNILKAPNEEISRPSIIGETLYYISGKTGTDQLFSMEIRNSNPVQITQSPFGIANYSVIDNTIVYSNYTSNGFQICKEKLNNTNEYQILNSEKPYEFPFVNKISEQEKGSINFEDSLSQSISYQSQPYSKLKRAFNFHSWAPLYIDGTKQNAGLGYSVMSQNLLSTTELTAGYKYSYEDRAGSYNIDFKYLGWYPRINFNATAGNRNSSYWLIKKTIFQQSNQILIDTVSINFSYKYSSMNLGADIPIDLTHGKWNRFVQPSINYNLTIFNPDKFAHESFPNGNLQYVNASLYFHQILKKSEQDLVPNFGIITRLNAAISTSGVKSYGSVWSIIQRFYLPGLMPNHGIKTYLGYQNKDRADYSFADQVRIARGYTTTINNSMLTLSADYLLPIAYPDFKLVNIFYLKRIQTTLFYDQSNLVVPIKDLNTKVNQQFSSTGVELIFDSHFLNFIAPIQIGGRTSYLLNNHSVNFELLFGIQFSF